MWNFFLKYCSVRTKKLHKMKLNFFFDTLKKENNLNWIYLHKIFVTMYSIPYTRMPPLEFQRDSTSDHTGHCATFLMSNHIWRRQERCVPLDCVQSVHWSFDYRGVIKTQFRINNNNTQFVSCKFIDVQ